MPDLSTIITDVKTLKDFEVQKLFDVVGEILTLIIHSASDFIDTRIQQYKNRQPDYI